MNEARAPPLTPQASVLGKVKYRRPCPSEMRQRWQASCDDLSEITPSKSIRSLPSFFKNVGNLLFTNDGHLLLSR